MKRFCTLTIACLLVISLLPGYASAGSAEPSTITDQAAAPDFAPDQLSELYREYTVKRGDNLISISKQFDVLWRDLATLNGIKGPRYMIIPGQILKIPLLPKLPGTTGNYLILCETEAQKQYLAEFAAFKILNGYSVTVKSVEADIKQKGNADTSEEIRQYLKKMDKQMSLQYVLLVGSPYDEEMVCLQHTGGAIPMRYMYQNLSNNDYSWYDGKNGYVNKTPTDIYYAFDFNWDFDKDGFAGEVAEVTLNLKQEKPELLFQLGRIPFSDYKDIKTVLDSTMQYEMGQKSHSDALIGSCGDWAYYGDALAKNLSNVKIETVTLFENDRDQLFQYKSTYPLNFDNFKREIRKKYDFVYTMGDIEGLGKRVEAGIFFIDTSATMQLDPGLNNSLLTAQDVLADGSVCAAIATNEDVGFNPENPAPRLPNRLFSNKTLSVSGEFYAAAQSFIMEDSAMPWIMESNLREAYLYCYLGDPSIVLKP